MSTTYECIKTYVKGQVWDEELGQNVQYKERSYADAMRDAQKRNEARDTAGDELDRLAKQWMEKHPGTTYRAALKEVMDAHPDLKSKYIKGV